MNYPMFWVEKGVFDTNKKKWFLGAFMWNFKFAFCPGCKIQSSADIIGKILFLNFVKDTLLSKIFKNSQLESVSYTHLRAHETGRNLVCRLLLEKKKKMMYI